MRENTDEKTVSFCTKPVPRKIIIEKNDADAEPDETDRQPLDTDEKTKPDGHDPPGFFAPKTPRKTEV